MWTPQILATGTLGASATVLFAPSDDTIVRVIQVVNPTVNPRTCTLSLVGSKGTAGIGTPSLPLAASESALFNEPIMLRGGVDVVKGLADSAGAVTYAIWGVVRQ